ncbi:hypothetical protein [Spiroplasma endosymbiont of Amphibalanus improvisus]|uniref:hypothetical protein n=1 Tax=Spiroplasma endosymbiont of Amphibalanus improvisus TaxID=3066327 RepID=UPI00313B2E91
MKNKTAEIVSPILHDKKDNQYVKRSLSVFKINFLQVFGIISYWIFSGLFIVLNLAIQIIVMQKNAITNMFAIVSWVNVILISIIAVVSIFYFFKKQIDEGYHSIEVRTGINNLSSFWQRILICVVMQFSPIILVMLLSLIIVLPSDIPSVIYVNKVLVLYLTYIIISILMSAITLFGVFIFKNSSIVIIVPILLSFVIFMSPFLVMTSSYSQDKKVNYDNGGMPAPESYIQLETNEIFEYYIANSTYQFISDNKLLGWYVDFQKLKDTNDNFTENNKNMKIYECGLFASEFLVNSSGAPSDFVGTNLSKFIDKINEYLTILYPNVNYSDCFLFNNNPSSEYQLTNVFDNLSKQDYSSLGHDNIEQSFLELMSKLSKNIEYISQNFYLDNTWKVLYAPGTRYIDEFSSHNNVSPLDYGVNWFILNAIRTSWTFDPDVFYFINHTWDRQWDKYDVYFNPLYHFSIMLSPPMNDSSIDKAFYDTTGTSFNRSTKIFIPSLKDDGTDLNSYKPVASDLNYYDNQDPVMSHINLTEKTVYQPAGIFIFWTVLSTSAIIGNSFLYRSRIKK